LPEGFRSYMRSSDVVSLLLRGMGSGGRLVLLIVMANRLPVTSVGEFGLVAATVGFAVYAMGLDYYTFTTRELIVSPRTAWRGLLREQAAVQTLAYLLVAILAVVVWMNGAASGALVVTTVALTAVDHVSLELHRILLADQQPVGANLLLALRSGVWGLVWAAAVLVGAPVETTGAVYLSWGAGSGLAVVVGLALVYPQLGAKSAARLDFSRIRRGLLVSVVFLVASLASKGMLTIDRYLLQGFEGAEAVGVYTFYAGIANVILLTVESGVLASRFPRLIASHRSGAPNRSAVLADVRRATTRATLISSAVLAAATWPLVVAIDRQEYLVAYPAFLLLVAGSAVSAWSLVPHYVLYALGRDSAIVKASIVGLVVMLATASGSVPMFGVIGAATATLAGHVATAIVRQRRAKEHA
jgi:hypothetical protein